MKHHSPSERFAFMLAALIATSSAGAGTEVGNGRVLPEPRLRESQPSPIRPAPRPRPPVVPAVQQTYPMRIASAEFSEGYLSHSSWNHSLWIDLQTPFREWIRDCSVRLVSENLRNVSLVSDRCSVDTLLGTRHHLKVEWDLPVRSPERSYRVESFTVRLRSALGPDREVHVFPDKLPEIRVKGDHPTSPIRLIEVDAASATRASSIRVGEAVHLRFRFDSRAALIDARLRFSLRQLGHEDEGIIPLVFGPGSGADSWISDVSIARQTGSAWEIRAKLIVPARYREAESIRIDGLQVTNEALQQNLLSPPEALEITFD